ncbi:Leucine-rich repeat-containing protein [Phytophthora nicotianae]|uniref:Leucine-rich repeat-containing protein n=1 Tax=Phytophthora nicotianae TaxID=4792 RepID=A0A0W8CAH4_PHYNI|nr:Leucine-rich repeat-containing protein [Phytophthora nicotianae]KUF83926.1 Leucine-rich repeat-containing protein [Phytophthora nicotianae]
MKKGSSFRDEHNRRRSRQSFRSQELLASLTLSAEAITLNSESGNVEEAAARASRRSSRRSTLKLVKTRSTVSHHATQSFATVANTKIMTMKKLKLMRKYRLGVHGSLREEDDDEMMDGPPIKSRHKSLMPINPAILPGLILSPTPKSPVKTDDKHAVGKFETHDSKWKATVDGEVEKFMYPSLRLETLYSDEIIPDTEDDSDEKPMPSPKTIDEVLTSTSKVSWELERVASSPVNGPVQEVDNKRLEFDQKLHDAETILRKREAASIRMNTAPPTLEGAARKSSYPDGVGSESMIAETGTSLHQDAVAPVQQPIPRLPQARKLIKEIQKHTTDAGQIEYYAEKKHLFTKWKKVGNSQHHQLSPLPIRKDEQCSSDEDVDSDLEPEGHDGSNQPFGKLSPRSLFYVECVKKQILPEPIFSRINEVAAPDSQPLTARHSSSRSSLADVTSMLMNTLQKNKRKQRGKRHLALQLQQFGLGDSKIIALSKSLREFQAIQVLDLSDNRLTDASIIPLLQSLAGTESTASDILNPDNRSPKAKLLAASQTINTGSCILTVLNLSKNELGRKGCQQVARFLAICKTLTYLDLSHTTLGGDDEAFAPVAAAIEVHPCLKRVNLSHNSIGERGGTLLGAMLTNPACVVQALDVSWNNIRRSGAVELGVAMRTNTSLRTLYMSMNRCGDGGGEQLAAALACNTTLTELDLSHNALTGASAVAFGFFLRQNESLRTLDMKDNSLGEVGARALLRAIALGSRCEISLSVHDLETSSTGSTSSSPIFDASLPSASSPFELKLGESPYAFAVASELIDAALYQGRCMLADLSYEEDIPRPAGASRNRAKSAKKRSLLGVDLERRCLYSVQDSNKTQWELPARGILRATATFMAPPLPRGPVSWLDDESCLGLIHIVKRGFSSRDMMSLLDLVLLDLQLTTTQATFFVSHLQSSLPKMELLGRLWTCLIDGENAFTFLQELLTQPEQWRLIDRFGNVVMQFSTANPTGHWTLTLRDPRHRKIALWFASLNAYHTGIVTRNHPKLTDCSQYGRGFHWRNIVFNQKRIQLTYSFFDRLPRDGVLEFDYVSPLRPEDRYLEENHLDYQDGTELDQTAISAQNAMTDEELASLLAQVGAEVCAVYVPVHKRQNLKYHLVLFHLAIAARRVMTRQAHHVLQHFPKNYESGRLRALVAMHHAIVDLECFSELLDRLALTDRPRVYMNLGYLNTVTPLNIDMDFEVDFTREDEKMLLRALVDLSISCPMDMIRIDSARSTVLIIYSMYQTNTVPASGRICFRYVSHQATNRLEWLRSRQQIYRHFLCGDRLKSLSDSAALALAASFSNDSNNAATNPTDSNTTTPA